MYSDQELSELLDRYINGTLSPAERTDLEREMNKDESFRIKVNQHIQFISNLRQLGQREKLQMELDEVHNTLSQDKELFTGRPSANGRVKKYWPIIAVAASVALFSIIGTALTLQSFEPDSKANYRELRRNVDQIKKSQRVIMEDIADINKELKEKDPAPGNYAGTGFLISANGYVATSYHVIKDADSVYIENLAYGRLKTSVFLTDRSNDIAILKIESSDVKFKAVPYLIQVTEADLGEDVYTLGFPREDIVYGDGTVSASTGYRQQAGAYQITVPVNPGNSGGPLLNQEGNLIGMISGMQTETAGASFATKSQLLLHTIQSVPSDSLDQPIVLARVNRLKNYTRVQQVKKLKEFVFVVKVYNTK
jgi:S1-C subfamily serine protease